jgi:hypothetical protein
MHAFQKSWVTRCSLAIVSGILFFVFLFLPGGVGTASASSVESSRLLQVTSASTSSVTSNLTSPGVVAISGGGCNTPAPKYIASCISVNGSGYLVPDAYLNYATGCSISVNLYRDGTFWTGRYYSGCYSAGAHLYGVNALKSSGHNWRTFAEETLTDGSVYYAYSPYMYT